MVNQSNIREFTAHSTPMGIIALVIVCTLLTSTGQIFLKLSSGSLVSFVSIFSNYYLWIGMAFYGLGALLLIIALKHGELSVLYPFIALSFVWVTILSIVLFHEHVSFHNWLGIASILAGVSCIGYGSGK
jgi:multidrug transporter EmrE-like cation transporter